MKAAAHALMHVVGLCIISNSDLLFCLQFDWQLIVHYSKAADPTGLDSNVTAVSLLRIFLTFTHLSYFDKKKKAPPWIL